MFQLRRFHDWETGRWYWWWRPLPCGVWTFGGRTADACTRQVAEQKGGW